MRLGGQEQDGSQCARAAGEEIYDDDDDDDAAMSQNAGVLRTS